MTDTFRAARKPGPARVSRDHCHCTGSPTTPTWSSCATSGWILAWPPARSLKASADRPTPGHSAGPLSCAPSALPCLTTCQGSSTSSPPSPGWQARRQDSLLGQHVWPTHSFSSRRHCHYNRSPLHWHHRPPRVLHHQPPLQPDSAPPATLPVPPAPVPALASPTLPPPTSTLHTDLAHLLDFDAYRDCPSEDIQAIPVATRDPPPPSSVSAGRATPPLRTPGSLSPESPPWCPFINSDAPHTVHSGSCVRRVEDPEARAALPLLPSHIRDLAKQHVPVCTADPVSPAFTLPVPPGCHRQLRGGCGTAGTTGEGFHRRCLRRSLSSHPPTPGDSAISLSIHPVMPCVGG